MSDALVLPRLLLVDDHEHLCRALERLLAHHFDVATASNGMQALELFTTEGPFPVVVTDQRMPVMDGATLVGRLAECDNPPVCLMLTGNAEDEAVRHVVSRGLVRAVLDKPVPTETLVAAVYTADREYRRKFRGANPVAN